MAGKATTYLNPNAGNPDVLSLSPYAHESLSARLNSLLVVEVQNLQSHRNEPDGDT